MAKKQLRQHSAGLHLGVHCVNLRACAFPIGTKEKSCRGAESVTGPNSPNMKLASGASMRQAASGATLLTDLRFWKLLSRGTRHVNTVALWLKGGSRSKRIGERRRSE